MKTIIQNTGTVHMRQSVLIGVLVLLGLFLGHPMAHAQTVSLDVAGTNMYALAIDETNGVLYGGVQDSAILYKCLLSTDCDASGDFTSVTLGISSIHALIVDEVNGVLYLGTFPGRIYRCLLSTGCDDVSEFTLVLTSGDTAILSFAIDTANSILYAGSNGAGKIFRCLLSTDCDASGDFTTAYDTAASMIVSLAVDTANGVLYAGSGTGGILYRCLTSTDCDALGDFTTAYDTTEQYFRAITFDTANGVLYAGTGPSGLVYRCLLSTGCDASGDFATATDTPETDVRSIAIDTNDGILYVGTGSSGNIYQCSISTGCDSAGDFTLLSSGLGAVYSIKIAPNGGFYAGTGGAIIYWFYYGDQAPLTLTATSGTYPTSITMTTSGGSGTGTVTYTAENGTASGCSIAGSTLSFTSAGTCLVAAHKAGTVHYSATSSATTTVTIAKGNQAALTVTNTTGAYPTGFNLSTSGGSGGGAVTYTLVSAGTAGCSVTSGGAVTFTSVGTCTVNATKAADTGYNATTSANTTVTVSTADPCSGGTVSYSGGYTYRTFTGNGTFSCSSAVTADVLVVGGGGGGGDGNGSGGSGYGAGGGGGAGGVVIANGKALSATSYSVTVGGGGVAGGGGNGGDSTFDTARAKGGGGGGTYGSPYSNAGGSGGGGPGMGTAGSSAYQPSGTGGANNYGGTGYGSSGGTGGGNFGFCNMGGGGGGGAGGAGGSVDPYYATGAAGTGVSVWSGYITVGYGGGGGPSSGSTPGTTYSSNYGSGGGGGSIGGSCTGGSGVAGIQGVVIVRYPTNPPTTVSVTPSSGTYSAGARSFATVYNDFEGTSTISYALFLLNSTVDGNNKAFYGLYFPSTNACHIFNSDDAGGWTSQNWSADVNASGAQSLPWVTLNSCSSTSSGNNLTVTWNLTFNSWNETLNTYLNVVDNLTASAGWVDHGDITVNTALPVVASTTVSSVGGSQVTAGGNVTSIGDSAITARGTCYDTSPSPTVNCTAEGGTSTGVFSHVRSGLSPNTLYYFRAYATNASGTSYSTDIATTTLSVPSAVSNANQTFNYGQSATSISTITMTDPTGSITAQNDIRIAIATSSVNMRWDTTDTTAILGGTAWPKVSNPVSYEGGGSVLVVPVEGNFVAGDTLSISGLSFKDFNSVNAPVSALSLRILGAGDPTVSAYDSRTIAILPTLGYVSHTLGQVYDQFNAPNVSGATLFAFKFVPAGETITVGPVVVQLQDVTGIVEGDISGVALYRDTNSNREYDGGDVAVGGNAVVSIGQNKTGTITFPSTFSAEGPADYILVGSVANLIGDDRMFVTLGTGNLTTAGATAGTVSGSGSLYGVLHVRTNKGRNVGGGGGITTDAVGGENTSTTTVVTTGGSEGTGGDFIDPDSGTPIGNEPGFFPPSGQGSPYGNWTNGSAGIVSDGSYASTESTGSQQSYAFTFDTIPTTNTIDGVAVKLEGHATTDGTVSVKLSWDSGSSVTTQKTTTTLTAVDGVYYLGSPSDKWGRTWSPSEFNNGAFRVEVISNVSEPYTLNLDAIQVKVFHRSTGGGKGGGGAVFSGPNTQYANVYTAVRDLLEEFLQFRRGE